MNTIVKNEETRSENHKQIKKFLESNTIGVKNRKEYLNYKQSKSKSLVCQDCVYGSLVEHYPRIFCNIMGNCVSKKGCCDIFWPFTKSTEF